jgi:hypothetical protein
MYSLGFPEGPAKGPVAGREENYGTNPFFGANLHKTRGLWADERTQCTGRSGKRPKGAERPGSNLPGSRPRKFTERTHFLALIHIKQQAYGPTSGPNVPDAAESGRKEGEAGIRSARIEAAKIYGTKPFFGANLHKTTGLWADDRTQCTGRSGKRPKGAERPGSDLPGSRPRKIRNEANFGADLHKTGGLGSSSPKPFLSAMTGDGGKIRAGWRIGSVRIRSARKIRNEAIFAGDWLEGASARNTVAGPRGVTSLKRRSYFRYNRERRQFRVFEGLSC